MNALIQFFESQGATPEQAQRLAAEMLARGEQSGGDGMAAMLARKYALSPEQATAFAHRVRLGGAPQAGYHAEAYNTEIAEREQHRLAMLGRVSRTMIAQKAGRTVHPEDAELVDSYLAAHRARVQDQASTMVRQNAVYSGGRTPKWDGGKYTME